MKKKNEIISCFDEIVKAQRLILSPTSQEKCKEGVYRSPIFLVYLSKQLENKIIASAGTFQVCLFGKNETFIVNSFQAERQPTLPSFGLQIISSTIVEMQIDANSMDTIKKLSRPDQNEEFIDFGEHVSRIKSLIDFNLLSEQLPIYPLKGVLVSGEKGSGKTFALKHISEILMNKGINIFNFDQLSFLKDKIIDQDFLKQKEPFLVIVDGVEDKSKEFLNKLSELFEMLASLKGMVIASFRSENGAVAENLIGPNKFEHEIFIEPLSKNERKNILERLLIRVEWQQTNSDFSNQEKKALPTENNLIKSKLPEEILETIALKSSGFTIYELKCFIREIDFLCFSLENIRLQEQANQILATESQKQIETRNLTLEDEKLFEARSMQIVNRAFSNVGTRSLKDYKISIEKLLFSEIGGYEAVKRRIRAVVELPLRSPELFFRRGIRPSKGILLYGPPGCSKTMFAKAIATEAQLNFISIKGPEIFNKYVGSSEKKVREIFRKARFCAPCVIFFDEIDAIAGSRDKKSDVSDRILTQLLTEIDGVENSSSETQAEFWSVLKSKQITEKESGTNFEEYEKRLKAFVSSLIKNMVIVVGATNRPETLDPAILRPGRFDELIFVSLPDLMAREAILRLATKSMPLSSEVDISALAEATEGYSGAEIVQICKEAAMQSIYGDNQSEEVTKNDFEISMKRIHKRVTKETLKKFENFEANDKFLF